MSPKRYYTFMIDPELLAALKATAAATPEWSEAAILRQALREWFDRNGVSVAKAAPRRAGTRRKASTRKQR